MASELAVETRLSQRPAVEANDTTALTTEQQTQLDIHKVTLRIENELYLRKHPEVFSLLSSFVSEVLLRKPKSIKEFAAGYFSDAGLHKQTVNDKSEDFAEDMSYVTQQTTQEDSEQQQ